MAGLQEGYPMASILIIYSTTDGHTKTICERLKQTLEALHDQVTVRPVEDGLPGDADSFDKIVIGASIRYGKHARPVYRMIKEHQALLDSKPNAFFSVNVVARKPAKRTPETNPYLKKFLKQIAWKPKQVAVFAGKLEYPKYKWWDLYMIRFIMWMTKGPTDPRTTVEFTDWNQVEEFAGLIHNM
jgi:menaquinone-dependent protoporphyrinogen oxidase